MKISLKTYFLAALITGTSLSLVSCGGGGGGSGATGAANVQIQAEPRSIDTGDRVKISIRVSEIHENGIALKVRFPAELSFVENSAAINDDDDEFGIVPDVLNTSTDDTYLVFYLQADDFGDNEEGSVLFELQGKKASDDSLIEVDPDVDDPLIDNGIEFTVDEPLFDAEDQTTVDVVG